MQLYWKNRLAGACLLVLATIFGEANQVVSTIGCAQDSSRDEGGRGSRRRSFDPSSYLQRLDANGNGSLEPSELSDRSRRFVEGLGFNPDETNSLERIKAKISGDQAESSGSGRGSSGSSGTALGSPERTITRKVPGFGVAAPTRQTVPNFTATRQPSSSELEGKYGDEIMQQVNAAMDRYDKNKDGKIDQGEVGEGRWGQPDPKESDLDKDGSLSRAEMAERYYRRTRGSSNDSSSSRSSSEERSSFRSRSSERESSSRFSRGDSSSESSRSSRFSRSEDSGGRSDSEESGRGGDDRGSESRSSDGGDRYRKYAEGLMESYDTDKDGNLSKEEVANMKQKPENADLDKNGLISVGELTEALANGNVGGSSSSSSSSSGGSRFSRSSRSSDSGSGSTSGGEGASRESGSSSRSSSRSSGGRFSFNVADKNGDGKVQMHEFTDQWSDEKFEEFRSYDKNKDGVITNAEYRGDSGRDR